MEQVTTNRNKLLAVLFALVLASVGLLAGCGGGEQQSSEPVEQESSATSESSSTSESASTTAAVAQQAPLTIGENVTGAASSVIKNSTGVAISAVSIAQAGSEDEPTALNIEGGTWANNREGAVFFVPSGENVNYNLTITESGKMYTLHDVPLTSISTATMFVADGVAYLSYSSNGSEVSTLEAEKALAAQAQQNAEQPAAEAPAPAAPVVVEDYDEDYYYDDSADDVFYDEDGNEYYVDEDGNLYTMDEDGNIISTDGTNVYIVDADGNEVIFDEDGNIIEMDLVDDVDDGDDTEYDDTEYDDEYYEEDYTEE